MSNVCDVDAPTVVCGVVIRRVDGQPEILLVRTRGDGVFTLPGGKLKTGECGEEALARELAEEVPGLAAGDVRFWRTHRCTAAGYKDRTFVVYLVHVFERESCRVGAEIEQLEWVANPLARSDISPATREICRMLTEGGRL